VLAPCEHLLHLHRLDTRPHTTTTLFLRASVPLHLQDAFGSASRLEQRLSVRLQAAESKAAAAEQRAQAAEKRAEAASGAVATLAAQVEELRRLLQLKEGLSTATHSGLSNSSATAAPPSAPRPAVPMPSGPASAPRLPSLLAEAAAAEQPVAMRRNAAALAEEAAMRLIQTLNAPHSPGPLPAPLSGGADPTPAAQRAAEALARARERIHRSTVDGGVTPGDAASGSTRASALMSAGGKAYA